MCALACLRTTVSESVRPCLCQKPLPPPVWCSKSAMSLMSILKRICITNYVFRSTTERRGTLDTLPQTPGTVSCFTSLFCMNMFSFHRCDHSRSMILCPELSYFFIITKRDKKARNNVIRACLTGLSAEHNDSEYLQHHLAHSFLPHIGPSLYSSADPHRVTQQESKSYFRNSAHSRSSKMEDACDDHVRHLGHGQWGSGFRGWDCLTRYFTFDLSLQPTTAQGVLCRTFYPVGHDVFCCCNSCVLEYIMHFFFSPFHIILGWKHLDVFWAFVMILSFCRVINSPVDNDKQKIDGQLFENQ